MEPAPPHIEIPVSDELKKEKEPSLNSEISQTKFKEEKFDPNVKFEKPSNEIQNNDKLQNNEIKNDITKDFGNLDIQQIEVAGDKSEERVQSNFNINFGYLDMRNKFMIKVYGILTSQFIFTFGLVLITQMKIIKNFLLEQKILCLVSVLICLFIYIACFIIFICKPDIMRRVPHNYIFLLIVTVCLTIILIFISAFYTAKIVIAAVSFLIAICLAIFFICVFNKIDIRFLAMAIVSLCFCMFNYGLLALIFRSNYLYFLYCFLAAIVFTLFIVYDTIQIRDHFSIDDYAFAALTLYLDIIRLFIEILKILGSAKQRH